MLTNWTTVQKQVERLKTLEKQEIEGTFETLSKKDYSNQRKEIDSWCFLHPACWGVCSFNGP